MRTTTSLLLLAALSCLQAIHGAQPRLRLRADRSVAGVGEPIALTVSVENAPGFACYGITALMAPGGNLAVTGQQAGAVSTFVPDSRADIAARVRVGGYAFADHPGGEVLLARITVVGRRPGSYTVVAPSFSPAEPFGALLLPEGSTERIVPAGDQITLTISGDGHRDITLRLLAGYLWDASAPDGAEVGPAHDGIQVIGVSSWQTAVLVPVPTAPE